MSIPKIQQPIVVQQNPQGQNLFKAPNGQIANKEKAQSIFEQKVTEKTLKRNNDVQAHEDAHEKVAGQYGSGKTIDFGSDQIGNPIATGGHVNVQMPGMVNFQQSLEQIEKTKEHARIVAAAAIAPESLGGEAGKLSAADKAVYAQATAALGSATIAKYQRMQFEARLATQGEKKPAKNQELTPEMFNRVEKPKKAETSNSHEGRKPINIFA